MQLNKLNTNHLPTELTEPNSSKQLEHLIFYLPDVIHPLLLSELTAAVSGHLKCSLLNIYSGIYSPFMEVIIFSVMG